MLPSKPRLKGEEKEAGRGREGTGWEGAAPAGAVLTKKVGSRCLILHCVCLGVCTTCVCEERSRWLLSGDELQKANCGKWFLKGI